MTERWVLASGNRGKLRELAELFLPYGVELVAQVDLGVPSPPEDAMTFVENALIKARNAAKITKMPAIADDSGLCVDALGGAPGIHSARYAGPDADDRANVAKLLEDLAGLAERERTARFHCVLVALSSPEDPAPLVAVGEWPGRISLTPSGDGGFGYDPVFFDPQLEATAAELSATDKNRVSHRAQALGRLTAALEKRRQGAAGA